MEGSEREAQLSLPAIDTRTAMVPAKAMNAPHLEDGASKGLYAADLVPEAQVASVSKVSVHWRHLPAESYQLQQSKRTRSILNRTLHELLAT